MDLQRVQKIDSLAKELMQQGLYEDREKAIEEAEKILAKKDYSTLSETAEEVKEIKPEVATEPETPLPPDQIKEILEKNTAFTVKKMKKFQQHLDALATDVESLRNQLNNIKLNPPQTAGEIKSQPQQTLTNNPPTDTQDHPRSGTIQSEDVSIEKFFYSGSKPKD